jgi:glycosyltransferase involved in cell wall biosynthesis
MVPPHGRVVFARGLTNQALEAAYSSAGLLLFPSLAEGFGRPIIEAQACGCPVLTTAEPPMNKIGGSVCGYLPLLRAGDDFQAWCALGAQAVVDMLSIDVATREQRSRQCRSWAAHFQGDGAIDAYLRHYSEALAPVSANLRPSPLES